MNKFLELSHKALGLFGKYEKVHVVMGNESCDLDSVISALAYAYFLYKNDYTIECGCTMPLISIPVLNINQDEFLYRTETKYFLKNNNISEDNLTFRNQIDLTQLSKENKLKMTLVDHHVLPLKDVELASNVSEVIDHRPIDPSSNVHTPNQTIELVGSCCTLIANKIIERKYELMTEELAVLLRGTIVLDTVNFNVDANRFTRLDVDMAEKLEKDFCIKTKRSDVYNELVAARSDISRLTPFQVLQRDMKVVDGLPIPGVPMLLAEFIRLEGVSDGLNSFVEKYKSNAVLLMGLKTVDDVVYRDIGVYGTEDSRLKKELIETLRGNKELNCEEISSGNIVGLVLFKQNNVKMSRKHIIPIVQTVIERNVKNEL